MNSDTPSPSEAQISAHAYGLWEQRGRPEGQSVDIWLAAEKALRDAPDAPASNPDRDQAPASADGSQRGPDPTNLDRALSPTERTRRRAARRSEQDRETEISTSTPRTLAHFLVTASRTALRIFGEEPRQPGQFTRGLAVISEWQQPEGRESYFGRDSDRQGRFPQMGARHPGMSIDERLPMQEEQERRLATELAKHLQQFLNDHPEASWDFAAGPLLHHAILDRLEQPARRRLRVALEKNLVHLPLGELRDHFPAMPGGAVQTPSRG